MPDFINSIAFLARLPTKMTEDFVPSPTFLSTEFAPSMTTFAEGCSTSIFRKNVPPSFVIVDSPMMSMYIFSNPAGPNDVFIASEIMLAAIRLPINVSLRPVLVMSSARMPFGMLNHSLTIK